MATIDWLIILVLVVFLTGIALYSRRYNRSVADFLVANRCAGRYVLSISGGIASIGVISMVASFEMYYKAGFSGVWWQFIGIAVATITALSGWIGYRLRQTRALTMAQFLEMRYSKNFRIFAGGVAWASGIINFGIFPAVSTRFFIHFCGLPDTFFVYFISMLILLLIALVFTLQGGQIAIMITDFAQGVIACALFVVIMVFLLYTVSWSQITEALSRAPQGQSMIHPFNSTKTEDFNFWYFLILSFTILYTYGIWLGGQGFKGAALTAHEARMGGIISYLRVISYNLFVLVLPVIAYVLINHLDFSVESEKIKLLLAGIDDSQIRTQMTTPMAMKVILPIGLIGAFVAIMLSAYIGSTTSYLHSWGSILVQDVLCPLRKEPLGPAQHIKWLRWSITGVAVFVFCFSLIFRQTEYIFMFLLITGAIFTGGAGAVVIGGLYWKRGTTAAAWSAMLTGSLLSVSVIIAKQIHSIHPFTGKITSYIFTRNGAVLAFFASCTAIIVYVLVSLLGKKKLFNLDKMLHRGEYAVIENIQNSDSKVSKLESIIGINHEFTLRDKMIYIGTLSWSIIFIAIFVFGTIYNFCVDVKKEQWEVFWYFYVWICLAISALVTVWLIFGGFRDIKRMFKLLNSINRDDLDDGTVFKDDSKACSPKSDPCLMKR